MQDTFVLKDVLRLLDGQETHTVHLVYIAKQPSALENNNNQTKQENPASGGGLRYNNYSLQSTTYYIVIHLE